MKRTARVIFEDELSRRRIAFERSDDGSYRLKVDGAKLIVSLDNIQRDAERDEDPEVVRRFVDQLVQVWPDVPGWEEASRLLLLSAESADMDFGDALQSKVTDHVTRVLTLTDADQSRVSWVTADMCEQWKVSAETAFAAALQNQDALLAGVKLEVEDIDGHKLGMVPLASVYKASVIFARAFRDLVAPELGWPVLVVIPCRDFIYVMADQSPLLGRIGEVVVREFRTSGYPITTEVLRVSDGPIEAIGRFPTGPDDTNK